METTLNSSSVNAKSLAVKNGLIWAAINIAIFLVVYYVKADLMGSFAFTGIQMLVGIGLAVYFCIDMRKQIGGYWSFKEALSNIFIMFFVQALVVYFFTVIFANQFVNNKKLMKVIDFLAVLFLLLLAYLFYAYSGQTTQNHNYLQQYVQYSPFLIGMVLCALNFLQIPILE